MCVSRALLPSRSCPPRPTAGTPKSFSLCSRPRTARACFPGCPADYRVEGTKGTNGVPPDGSRKSQNMISSWVSNFMISIFPPGSEWFPVASVEGNYPRLGKPPRHAILNRQASVGYAKEFGSTGSQGTTGPRTTLSQPPSRARFLIRNPRAGGCRERSWVPSSFLKSSRCWCA